MAFRLFKAIAGDIQLQDDAMMHEAIDGSRGGHRVLEYLLPLAERQVAGQHHTAPLIPFGQKGKKHLHFLAALLDVSQVIDNQRVKLRKSFDHFSQSQVPLGNQ